MKKLARILTIIIALICIAPATNAQFRLLPSAGVTMTTLKFKQDLAPVSQVIGGQAGVLGELMFPGIGFGLDLGLMYNMAGAEVNFGDKTIWASQGYGKERLMIHQLLIPMHLKFKYTRLNGFEDYLAPFVFAGPEFSLCLAHNKCEAVEYPGGDVQLAVGAGFEIKKNWQLSASYTWGMSYVTKTTLLQDYSARSRQWTLRLSYHF